MSEHPPLKLNREQIQCLAAPFKREIVEVMMRLQAASIPELTREMERSPKSLYYHVRQLCAVGLLQVREVRRSGKREEAVYELVSSRLIVEETVEDEETRKAAKRSLRALLRRIEREFQETDAPDDPPARQDKDVFRILTRLRPEAAERLRTLLEAAARFARENDDPEAEVRLTLTVFMTSQEYGAAEGRRRERQQE